MAPRVKSRLFVAVHRALNPPSPVRVSLNNRDCELTFGSCLIKKRGWFGDKEKEPNGSKPNGNHDCEEENNAAFRPIHTAILRRSLLAMRCWLSETQ
jgi:hypothetical protein